MLMLIFMAEAAFAEGPPKRNGCFCAPVGEPSIQSTSAMSVSVSGALLLSALPLSALPLSRSPLSRSLFSRSPAQLPGSLVTTFTPLGGENLNVFAASFASRVHVVSVIMRSVPCASITCTRIGRGSLSSSQSVAF